MNVPTLPATATKARYGGDGDGSVHRTTWQLVGVLVLGFILSSCATGGGRFQEKMCSGKPMFDVLVKKWPAPGNGRTGPVDLTYTQWLPPHGVTHKAMVIAVPGLDESCNEWTPLAEHLAKHGYEVYSSDLRGQGKDFSSKDRGNFHDWNCWVKDVQDFTKQMLRDRKMPVAYVGQSLGSMVAFTAAATAPPGAAPDAVVLQSPAFIFAYPPMLVPQLAAVLQVLTLNQARASTPVVLKIAKTKIVSTCHDEAAWETSSDRVCSGFTLRYIGACFRLGKHAKGQLANFKSPVLLQYGSSDVQWKRTKRTPCEIAASIGSDDKDLWWHPNRAANHDMQLDSKLRGPTLKKTVSWLDSRLFARH